MDNLNENVIEWIRGQSVVSITFTQEKYRNKIESLAKRKPNECIIKARNEDNSILAQVPLSWIKISPPKHMTDEQRQQAGDRLRNIRNA